MTPEQKHKALAKRMRRKYTRTDGVHPGYVAYLQIDHQGFEVVSLTTRRRANWFRDQLAVALARLVENEGGK